MSNCQDNCSINECVPCVIQHVQRSLFNTIQCEQEGEITEDWYEEKLDKFCHQEVDEWINVYSNKEAEHLIYKYGIHKAIQYYNNECGSLEVNKEVNVCKTILFYIVWDGIDVSFEKYQKYCEENPMD